MNVDNNLEERRLHEEKLAERAESIRLARRRTRDMRKKMYADRRLVDGRNRAEKWMNNHRKAHQEADSDMVAVSHGKAPLNRQGRRKFAKRMNAFKMPNGWKNFNEGYGKRFGTMESVSRGNRARKDAAKAAKLKNNSNSIIAAMKGDK